MTSNKTVSGQYLQPTSTVVAGDTCSAAGAISKDSSGSIYSCANGVWRQPSSSTTFFLHSTITNGGRPTCYMANPATGSCSCPTNQTAIYISKSTIVSYEYNPLGNEKDDIIYYYGFYGCFSK